MYKCNNCNYQTTRKQNLERHLKRKTPCKSTFIEDKNENVENSQNMIADSQNMIANSQNMIADSQNMIADCNKCGNHLSNMYNLQRT